MGRDLVFSDGLEVWGSEGYVLVFGLGDILVGGLYYY